jgi:hypothetical protein
MHFLLFPRPVAFAIFSKKVFAALVIPKNDVKLQRGKGYLFEHLR